MPGRAALASIHIDGLPTTLAKGILRPVARTLMEPCQLARLLPMRLSYVMTKYEGIVLPGTLLPGAGGEAALVRRPILRPCQVRTPVSPGALGTIPIRVAPARPPRTPSPPMTLWRARSSAHL